MEFDWPRILKGQGAPATEPRPPAETRRQRPDNRRSQPQTPPQATPAPRPLPPRPAAESPRTAARRDFRGRAGPGQRITARAPRPKLLWPSQTRSRPRRTPESVRPVFSSSARRYADLVARIAERTDDTRRAELKEQADRLNPDSWVTDDQVSQGLEQDEAVLASLREVAGQKRRRRRRGKGPRPASAEGTAPPRPSRTTPGPRMRTSRTSSPDGDSEPGES